MSKSVDLMQRRDPNGDSRRLTASLLPDGALRLEGQDLGPGVEAFFGAGNREYEYDIVVAAGDVPALLAAQQDVLAALAATYRDEPDLGIVNFLDAQGIDLPPEASPSRVRGRTSQQKQLAAYNPSCCEGDVADRPPKRD